MLKPPRLPLETVIPDDHPQKAEIEQMCLRLLEMWGSRWRISIHPSERGWSICIGFGDGRGEHRRVPFGMLDARAIEKWMREAVRQIRAESDLQFGMIPVGELSTEQAAGLVDLVGAFAGRLHPDGWITLPETGAWPAFLARAQHDIGVTLAASVRENRDIPPK